MRTRVLAAALLILASVSARAENPLSCSSGSVSRLKFNPGRTTMRFVGTFTSPVGFDPAANGLTLDLWNEPETDPANAFYTTTLPSSGFVVKPNGQLRYTDTSGAQGGITLVKISIIKTGDRRIILKRKAASAVATPAGGVFRMVLTSGTTCVRHCGSSCSLLPNGKLKCAKSTDTALCGYRSGCELLNASAGNCLYPYP